MADWDNSFDFDQIGSGMDQGVGGPLDITSSGVNGQAVAGSGVSGQAGLTGAFGLAGLGLEALGIGKEMSAASQETSANVNIAGLEMQVNDQRKQQMILSAQRQQIQNVRNVQQTQAMGKAAGVAQGGQFGSGVAGGQAAAAAQGGYNAEGINQNLEIGKNIFGLDNQIDQQKINLAYAQQQQQQGSGLASLGGGLVQGASSLASLAMFL